MSATERTDLAAPETHLVLYPVSAEEIEAKRAEYAAITCDTPAGYEACRKAIAHCRTTRTAIDARRKDLKAESLDWGRRVDAAAKTLTALIVSIEAPLDAKKTAVDDAKAAAKAEAEEARQREVEAKVRAEREAEEARLRDNRLAEEARLRDERAAFAGERLRHAEEQRAADERAAAARESEEAAQRAERERLAEAQRVLDAQRAEFTAEQARLQRAEDDRQAHIKAEADAKAQAERDRIAAEEARIAELERIAAETARLEALKPDAEKLHVYAAGLRGVVPPKVKSREAKALLAEVNTALGPVIGALDTFGQ